MGKYILFIIGFCLLVSPAFAGESTMGIKLDRWGISSSEDAPNDHSTEMEKVSSDDDDLYEHERHDVDDDEEAEIDDDAQPPKLKNQAKGDKPAAPKPDQPAAARSAKNTKSQQPYQMPEDRPSIIHQKPLEKTTTSPRTKQMIAYRDDDQKKLCEGRVVKLEETYTKARYYSISGDSCSTAKFAEQFLELIGSCTTDCPQDTLAMNGYDREFIRNMSRLKELGKGRCLLGGK